jgi:hypothetical protein
MAVLSEAGNQPFLLFSQKPDVEIALERVPTPFPACGINIRDGHPAKTFAGAERYRDFRVALLDYGPRLTA